ncbi:glycoside hydrolase family 97 protein [Leeuwenhoekiella palythoae]|uniref:Glycosyl hydrolase family 97 n=1 Tax=Leeuwenhoekiella palythoae TaxID=573501 RepID=A0A1M5Y1P3_9FLAO|nr:glycoside hydrolase family 97 protein [Leeuwenhoekiella palythoae]RXG30418.1 glycosyl hydrolase family 97 [Leeuwenhoekiella palythoae]UBZ10570.1 glycoside hydrolase family 97 protein [Leeuwenhoekiella palythoae]SHI05991.1 Glycosyl-hydrolase 97 C-terminal, oligomerisation [Leeuwenhoekiella palythoae]HCQ76219.1 alpha-glucosidase [Leeuwenhoekiella sp.]
MQKFRIASLVSLFFILTGQTAWCQLPVKVSSPDKHIGVEVGLQDEKPVYSIHVDDVLFMEDSPLGLKTSIGDFSEGLSYAAQGSSAIKEAYDLKKAKVSHVEYHANELIVKFVNANEDTLAVQFRVSNSDVAFAYKLTAKERNTKVKILEEATGFNLPDDATSFITPQALPMTGWEQTKPSYEEEYTFDEALGTQSQYGVGYTFPALFKNAEKGWILISETNVDGSYPGARLGESDKNGLFPIAFPQEGENNGLGDAFAAMAMPAQTPWRTITLGKTLKPIVETTASFDLVEQRYEASQDYTMGRATWSWIVWQDNSINYEDQVKFIDLAEALNFEYVLIDNWWDANIGREKMEELVAYANSKNVDVVLWYNSNGFWNNAPQTPQDFMNTAYKRQQEMAWLQEIGVKGLKIDFFGGDKQMTMQLYEDILNDGNDYGLAITFHGCTLPRGWEKMYPNYVTSEAVRASENLIFTQYALDKHAYYSTILPFTRNPVGAMDFAPVFLNKRLSKDQKGGTVRKTTDAFELATAVLYFSPIQHFGLTPNNLDEQPEFVLDFLRAVPTVWDETVYVGGEPGDYVAIARRKGDTWYLAVTNGEQEKKTLELDLPMFKNAEATFIYDAKDKTAAQKTVKVKSSGKLKIDVLGEGGALLISK